MNEHQLPSSLPEGECMIYLGGPRMSGLLRFTREQIAARNAEIATQAEHLGLVGYEAIRDHIMQGLHYAFLDDPAVPVAGDLQTAGAMGVWVVWNNPETTMAMRDTLRWMTFGADQRSFLMLVGTDDGAFEAARMKILEKLTGETTVLH